MARESEEPLDVEIDPETDLPKLEPNLFWRIGPKEGVNNRSVERQNTFGMSLRKRRWWGGSTREWWTDANKDGPDYYGLTVDSPWSEFKRAAIMMYRKYAKDEEVTVRPARSQFEGSYRGGRNRDRGDRPNNRPA